MPDAPLIQPRAELDEEEPALLVCAQCGTEVITEREPWPEYCPRCQRPFDLAGQFAFMRARDAFTAGQELIIHISPGRRMVSMTSEDEMAGVQCYIQAYSALQKAFTGELAESQRRLGIEMMAAMVRVFVQHGMISPMESAYWSLLMVEMNSQIERDELETKINSSQSGGLREWVLQWRWKSRRTQLEDALRELNRKIQILERQIAFVEKPRARRIDPVR
jgi:hypothetical protein